MLKMPDRLYSSECMWVAGGNLVHLLNAPFAGYFHLGRHARARSAHPVEYGARINFVPPRALHRLPRIALDEIVR